MTLNIIPGNFLRISSTPFDTDFVPGVPIGEKGDIGIVNYVGTNHFRMLLPNGETRSYSLKAGSVQLSSRIVSRFRDLLKDRYNQVLSKGDTIYLGSDPEIFVTKPTGEVIPAWEYLPQSPDHKPKVHHNNYSDAAAFYDGAQAEFTTIPSQCLAYHIDSIQKGLELVITAARKKFPDAQLCCKPVLEIPQSILNEAEETYVMLGCAPSRNIYPDVESIDVGDPRKLKVRFAGGHVHLGEKVPQDRLDSTVRILDTITGVCITAALRNLDDPVRRKYYGRAGEFRLPPWGLEYRTLPSTILVHPALTNLAFDLSRQALWLTSKGYDKFWVASEQEVRSAINDSDYNLARKIVLRNIPVLRAMLMTTYSGTTKDPNRATNIALRIILEGIQNLVSTDIESNWRINSGTWIAHAEAEGSTVCNLQLQ